MTFGAWAPRKSESVYYNLQFWLFLGFFLNFSRPGHIFSPNVPKKADVRLRRCLAPFVLSRKASKHPICSFLVKSKTDSK